MIIAELPLDEELRLLDLASYGIMDTESETDFNELVELAGDICNCPVSLISFLDADRQWFKAKKGTTITGTERDVAFCAHTILQDQVMKVENTNEDIRFFQNPLVTGEEHIRFYAGAPIFSTEGYKLGTICVIDRVPKKLTQKEERALTILSNQVTKLLELRKNKLLIRKASEIIAIKSNTIGQVINNQEHEKSDIAYNLQEDIAQRLSSVKLYLSMAKTNETKWLEFMSVADSQISDLLKIIRNLSYSIAPYTYKWIPAEILIEEFIEKIGRSFPFSIRFNAIVTKTKYPAKDVLVLIRVIELWFKFLTCKKEISQVNVTVHSGDTLEILIENNGPVINVEEQAKYIFESSIYERAKANEGIVDLSVSPDGNNILKLILSNGNNS